MKRGHDGRPFMGPPQSFPPPPVYYPPPQMHSNQYPMQKTQPMPTSGYVHVSHPPPPNAYPNYGYGQLPPRNNYQRPPAIPPYPIAPAYPQYPPPPPSATYMQAPSQFHPHQPQIFPSAAPAAPSYATPPYQQVVALNTTPPGHGPPAKKPRHEPNSFAKNTASSLSMSNISTPSSGAGFDSPNAAQNLQNSVVTSPVPKADDNLAHTNAVTAEESNKSGDTLGSTNKNNNRNEAARRNQYRNSNIYPQAGTQTIANNANGHPQFFSDSHGINLNVSNGDRGRSRGNGLQIKAMKHQPANNISTGSYRSTNRGRWGLSRGGSIRGNKNRSKPRDSLQREDTPKDANESKGKRTLTDFRISRLAISSLGWEWETILMPTSSESISESTGKHRRDEDDQDDESSDTPHNGKGKKVKSDVEKSQSKGQDYEAIVEENIKDLVKIEEADQKLSSPSNWNAEKSTDKTDEDVYPKGVAKLSVNEPASAQEPATETSTLNFESNQKAMERKEIDKIEPKQSRKGKRNMSGVINGRENSRLRIYFASPITEPMRTMHTERNGESSNEQSQSCGMNGDRELRISENSQGAESYIPLYDESESVQDLNSSRHEETRSSVEDKRDIEPSSSIEQQQSQTDCAIDVTNRNLPLLPSADRISISYARNSHRILIDADVVDKILVYRTEGRIEVSVRIEPVSEHNQETSDPNRVCKGLLIEALDPDTGVFTVVDRRTLEESTINYVPPHPEQRDENSHLHIPCLPPLWKLSTPLDSNGNPDIAGSVPKNICVIAHLDKHNPLTEARWLRNGDADAWIAQMTGQGVGSSWCGKIQVVDPDPAPTFQHALNSWKDNSNIASKDELESFVSDHMSNIDNVLEILLRIIRGDHRMDKAWSRDSQSSAVATLATKIDAPYPERQTHVSLATFALFRLAVDTAKETGQDLAAIHRKASDIVRALPYNLLFKALDTMARDYLVDKCNKAQSNSDKL